MTVRTATEPMTMARGQLRRFKAELIRDHAIVARNLQVEKLQDHIIGATIKTSKTGRQRALQKVRQYLPGVRLEWQTKHYSLFSELRARGAVLAAPSHPGEMQDAVSMDFIIVGESLLKRNAMTLVRGLWSIEASDHSLVRMFHRSPGMTNAAMRRNLYEAHDWFMQAKYLEPMPLPQDIVYLPAGDGVFLGHIISGVGQTGGEMDNELIFYFRARTWLHQDQVYDNQTVMQPGKGEDCFGRREMLPGPLRLIRETKDRCFDIMPLPKPAFANDILDHFKDEFDDE